MARYEDLVVHKLTVATLYYGAGGGTKFSGTSIMSSVNTLSTNRLKVNTAANVEVAYGASTIIATKDIYASALGFTTVGGALGMLTGEDLANSTRAILLRNQNQGTLVRFTAYKRVVSSPAFVAGTATASFNYMIWGT